jgi:4-amino-4-deoxy-L-arabinose transferase-like glycosyltransferase
MMALLVLAASEIFLSNRQESQVWDEADHLYAGYEYWKHADFGRNPEHPPLAKLVAASALLPLHLTEPDGPNSNFKLRDFYDGTGFLYAADADRLLARARGMMLIFSLGLALAVFAAGREMFGPEAGLLAMALFCLEPMLLANGGLVTTDMTLSCLLFVSVNAFYRYVKRPTVLRLLVCSIAVGLTLVAKQSGVFVFPILAAVALVDKIRTRPPAEKDRMATRAIARLAFAFVCIAVVSYGVLWAIYGFRYAARVAGPPMLPTLNAYIAAIPNSVERAAIGLCARYHLLPEAYLYGWSDILQIPGKRVSLVLGKLTIGPHWFLFPEMILMKTTIALLVLLALVPFAGISRHQREFLFMAIPAAFYLLIAVGSGMNAEARYILPVYPFCIVLAGAAGWDIAHRSRRWAVCVATLLIFAAASSLHAFPDYLAYSNEAFGGPSQSYHLVAGANGDWAQSLKWVKSYLDRNHVSDCWFDYTDPDIDPKYYGIACKPLLTAWVPRGYPFLGQVPPIISGTVLISATELAGRQWGPDTLNPYAQFRGLQPDAKLGNVVLVYHGTFAVPLAAAYSHSATAERLAEQGKMAEAIAEEREAVKLAPDSANIQAGLGLTLIEAGQKQEGQQVNATALRIARSVHPEFQEKLIRLLEKPGMAAANSK